MAPRSITNRKISQGVGGVGEIMMLKKKKKKLQELQFVSFSLNKNAVWGRLASFAFNAFSQKVSFILKIMKTFQLESM